MVFDRALFPAFGEPNLDLLWMLAALMAGVIAVTSGIGILQTYLTNSVGQWVMRDLRDRLFHHLQSLSLNFFTGTRTGEVQSRVANDVGGVRNVVTTTVTNVVSNVVILISTIMHRSHKRRKQLPHWQQRRNALIGPIRKQVEKVLGTLKRSYGYSRVRYKGLQRNAVEMWFKVMTCNLRRAGWIALRPWTWA